MIWPAYALFIPKSFNEYVRADCNAEPLVSVSSGESLVAVPQLELVVARSSEKLEWLSRVPSFWQITILNRVSSAMLDHILLEHESLKSKHCERLLW